MKQNYCIWKERVTRRIQDMKRIAEYGDEENAVRFERAGSVYFTLYDFGNISYSTKR